MCGSEEGGLKSGAGPGCVALAGESAVSGHVTGNRPCDVTGRQRIPPFFWPDTAGFEFSREQPPDVI